LQLCFGFGFASIANCIKYMMAYMPLDMVIDQPGTSKIPQEKEMEVLDPF
jgi:cyclin E